jgi:hypothetical protein
VNIGHFPGHRRHAKFQALYDYITSGHIDVLGLQEINIHWKKKVATEQIPELIRLWPGNYKVKTSYFKDYQATSSLQVGGVSQWARGEAADRTSEAGEDETGLGRWAWQKLLGKRGTSLRIVTAYGPVVNKGDLGSVWSQQRGFWTAQDELTCPRQRFESDLIQEIDKWIEAGDQILLLIDMNGHVQQSSLAKELWEREIRDLVTNKHGSGPATFHGGSEPIDGIFATSGLWEAACGYMEAPGDHLGVWADIPKEWIFGGAQAKWVQPQARRLRCEDPRVVARYTKELERLYEAQNIQERSEWLYKNRNSWSAAFVEAEWNKIDKAKTEAMLTAEKRCRHLPKGRIQWSPEYGALTAELKAWKLIARKRQGKRVNSRYLSRTLKRAGMLDRASERLDIAEAELRIVKGRIKEYALRSTEARQQWLEGLAAAKAIDSMGEEDIETQEGQARLQAKTQTFIKLMLQREEQRRYARTIKWANGGGRRTYRFDQGDRAGRTREPSGTYGEGRDGRRPS